MQMVLTLRSGGSKLEREISTQKGKRSCRRRERTFTKEFKLEAVQLVRSSNKSQAQIARDLGIADSTLHHWCKLLSEQGEQAFPGSGHPEAPGPHKKRKFAI